MDPSKDRDATVWNEKGPEVPPIILGTLFLVIGASIILFVTKLVRLFWDLKRKSNTYSVANTENDDTAVLKKSHYDEFNDPQLNSCINVDDSPDPNVPEDKNHETYHSRVKQLIDLETNYRSKEHDCLYDISNSGTLRLQNRESSHSDV